MDQIETKYAIGDRFYTYLPYVTLISKIQVMKVTRITIDITEDSYKCSYYLSYFTGDMFGVFDEDELFLNRCNIKFYKTKEELVENTPELTERSSYV